MSNYDEAVQAFEDANNDLTRLEREMRAIHERAGDRPLTGGEAERWENLRRAVDKARNRKAVARTGMLDALATRDGVSFTPAAPDSFHHMRRTEVSADSLPIDREARRSAAITAVERGAGSDEAKQAATVMLERYDHREQGDLALWATVTSSPDYARAWAKVFTDSQRGHQLWTDAEREAFQQVETFTRAIANTSAATGAGLSLPLALDPAVGLTNSGKLNPLGRQLARQVTIVGTDTWRKNTSAGVTAAFADELTEVADGSPTFATRDIKAHKWHAFVQASYEAWQDIANLPGEVTRMFTDAADRLEAEKLMSGAGDGSDEPWGAITRLTAVTNSRVLATTAGQFGFPDVLKIDEALPTRFRDGSAWMANRKVMNLIRQFASGSAPQAGEFWVDARQGNPATLLGQNIYETDTALGFTAATNSTDRIITVGNWFESYAVVRRAPTIIVDVPVMVGPNQRPTGARGWYAFGRTGGDTVINEAARVLMSAAP